MSFAYRSNNGVDVVGAQAYTDEARGPEINTTDATWLATRLCQRFETDAEEAVTFPNRGTWGYDWTGDVLYETVERAHRVLPIRYDEWLVILESQDTPSKWSARNGEVYSRCDWVQARRFIQQCARNRTGFHVSY